MTDLRAALLGGACAIVATDTVYGLAAALDSEAGIDALYALKGRDRSQPCQVLIYDANILAQALAPLPEPVRRAASGLLPGRVTCLVPDPTGRFAAAAGAEPGSVGLRAPRMEPPVALDIPLIATSANDPGGPDPTRIDDVPIRIRDAAPARIARGTLTPVASSVVDLRPVAEGRPAALIREGADPDGVRAALEAEGVSLTGSGPPAR
jgi:L-threonylcarbamoyladenylate synthase